MALFSGVCKLNDGQGIGFEPLTFSYASHAGAEIINNSPDLRNKRVPETLHSYTTAARVPTPPSPFPPVTQYPTTNPICMTTKLECDSISLCHFTEDVVIHISIPVPVHSIVAAGFLNEHSVREMISRDVYSRDVQTRAVNCLNMLARKMSREINEPVPHLRTEKDVLIKRGSGTLCFGDIASF